MKVISLQFFDNSLMEKLRKSFVFLKKYLSFFTAWPYTIYLLYVFIFGGGGLFDYQKNLDKIDKFERELQTEQISEKIIQGKILVLEKNQEVLVDIVRSELGLVEAEEYVVLFK